MSWSVQIIGTPEKINEALDKQQESLRDQSLAEYQEALPHLKGLVSQIVTTATVPNYGSLVSLRANGHATFENGKKVQGTVSVALDPFYGTLAL